MGLAEEFLFGSTTDWTKAGWNSKKNFITREKASCKRYPFSSAHVEQRGVVALADENVRVPLCELDRPTQPRPHLSTDSLQAGAADVLVRERYHHAIRNRTLEIGKADRDHGVLGVAPPSDASVEARAAPLIRALVNTFWTRRYRSLAKLSRYSAHCCHQLVAVGFAFQSGFTFAFEVTSKSQ